MIPIILSAQQDVILTKYSFNGMFFNPAIAGSTGEEQGSAFLNYRDQWMGLDGSPQTFLAGTEFNLFRNRVGLGLTLGRESIGVDSRTEVMTNYSYRVRVSDGYLAIGIRAGFNFYRSNLNDIKHTDRGDRIYDQGDINQTMFSVGSGLYYHQKNFFVGFSVPAISVVNGNGLQKTRHYYVHTGASFALSEYSDIKLDPEILLKYVSGAPLQFTLGTRLWLIKDLNIGMHYRSSDAFALSTEFIISDQLTIGASYDFPTMLLKETHNGTIELLVGYKFNYAGYYIPMSRR